MSKPSGGPRRTAGLTRCLAVLVTSTLLTGIGADSSWAQTASFRSVDTNGDRVLDFDELVAAFGERGARSLLSSMDRNRNGQITFPELRGLDRDSASLRDRAVARRGRTAGLQALLQGGLALSGLALFWAAGQMGTAQATLAASLSVMALEEEMEELELLDAIEDDIRAVNAAISSLTRSGDPTETFVQIERLAALLDGDIDDQLDKKINAALEEELEETEEVLLKAAAFRA
ncbi:EF-hand domain-containing protein [Dinoroseobacter sp. S124A]|uniref:EF-hand domain-containing protein n=1 Tax=Dinoroseobacter sp. S124A TaxID=3415128 RepID=UPI003C7E1011